MDAPGGDGIPNLMKMACNLDPRVHDYAMLTPGTGTRGLPSIQVIGSGAATKFRVEYLRRTDMPGVLDYTIEMGSGLDGGWIVHNGPETVNSMPGEDGWERVVVEIPSDPAAEPRMFCRVRVVSLVF